MTDRRVYKRPPIHEAICEFRFTGSGEWNLLTAADMLDHLRSDYPDRPRTVVDTNLEIAAGGPEPTVRPLTIRERVQYVQDDPQRLVTAGQDFMSIHVSMPYEGWEKFRPRIASALTAYQSVLKPKGATRVGVRYVNKILIDDVQFQLSDYFMTPPSTPDGLDLMITDFLIRVGASFLGDRENLHLTQTLASIAIEDPDRSAFILDLDAWEGWNDVPAAIADLMAVVDTLREAEREAFEAMITDKLRMMFDA